MIKVINVLADGIRLDSMAGHIVKLEEAPAFYRLLDEMAAELDEND